MSAKSGDNVRNRNIIDLETCTVESKGIKSIYARALKFSVLLFYQDMSE